MLTLIPEEERSINHRYTIVLVGENARELAQVAANSEMAEAYKPRAAEKPRIAPISEVEGEEAPEQEPVHDKKVLDDEKLVVFCPTGSNTKELARLRLHPCVGFSESMPLTKDSAAANTLIVAFLLWRVERGDTAATKSTINEWYSRMAEINHHKPSNLKPHTLILAYEADDNQENSVNEFADKQKNVEPKFYPDASEDGIMESLQEVAEAAIQRTREKMMSPRGSSDDVGGKTKNGKKGCMSAGCSTM